MPPEENQVRKESGLIVNVRLVPAMLDGTKTQTRRIVALPRKRNTFVVLDHGDGWWPFQSDDGESAVCSDGNEYPYSAPYGLAGDLVYVRESGAQLPLRCPEVRAALPPPVPARCACHAGSRSLLGATHPLARRELQRDCTRAQFLTSRGAKVVPAIHMPKWAARTWAEIKEVKVERLQDISEEMPRAKACNTARADGAVVGTARIGIDSAGSVSRFVDQHGWGLGGEPLGVGPTALSI